MAEKRFSMRIVCLDYYMSSPLPGMDSCYNSFHGQAILEVPVIRIYGSCLSGQKTCLHIHGAFPYLYVPYESDLPQNLQEGYNFVRCLASAIEKAMKLNSSACANRQHVHSCNLVRAKKFYGFHTSEQLFIKIILYYPHEVSRVTALLLGGGLLNRVFQPYESHIPFLLQFMIDHNLYGMGHLHLSRLKLRHPMPDKIPNRADLFQNVALKLKARERNSAVADSSACRNYFGFELDSELYSQNLSSELQSSNVICNPVTENRGETSQLFETGIWLKSTVPADWLWSSATTECTGSRQIDLQLKKQSICELEGDGVVADILNCNNLMYKSLSEAGPEVKMVQSLVPIWEDEVFKSTVNLSQDQCKNTKPSAATILKTLSHGENYENLLSKLFPGENCKGIPPVCHGSGICPEKKDVAGHLHDTGGSVLTANLEDSLHEESFANQVELLNSTQAANGINCNRAEPSVPTSEIITIQGEQILNPIAAVVDEHIVKSQMSQGKCSKDTDAEVIELLQWLASSQTVHDLNFDDNDGEGLFLSDLLRSNSIDGIKEKAHLGYEDASQRECDDILNSLNDNEHNFVQDELKDKNQSSVRRSRKSCTKYSSDDLIPQLDGCWEEEEGDISRSLRAADKKKRQRKGTKAASSSSSQDDPEAKVLWGSIPLTGSKLQGNINEKAGSCLSDTSFLNQDILSSKRDIFFSTPENITETSGESSKKSKRRKHSLKDETESLACQDSSNDAGGEGIHNANDYFLSTERINDTIENMDKYSGEKALNSFSSLTSSGSGSLKQSFEIKDCSERRNDSRYGVLPLLKPLKQETNCLTVSSHDCCNLNNQRSLKHQENKFSQDLESSDKDNHHETEAVKENLTDFCRDEGMEKLFDPLSDKRHLSNNSENNIYGLDNDMGQRAFTDCHLANKGGRGIAVTENSAYVRNEKLPTPEKDIDMENTDERLHSSSSEKYLNKALCFSFSKRPPTKEEIQKSFEDYSLTPVDHGEAYYGCGSSVSTLPGEGRDVRYLPSFFKEKAENQAQSDVERLYINKGFWVPSNGLDNKSGIRAEYQNDGSVLYILTPSQTPPKVSAVKTWLMANNEKFSGNVLSNKNDGFLEKCEEDNKPIKSPEISLNKPCTLNQDIYGKPQSRSINSNVDSPEKVSSEDHFRTEGDISQITAPSPASVKLTPLSQKGFRDPASLGAGQQLTLMSIEVHAESRGELRPDPRYDAVNLIVAIIQEDSSDVSQTIILIRDEDSDKYISRKSNIDGLSNSQVFYVKNEMMLFCLFTELVLIYDPDILMGWEIQRESIGFLSERAAYTGLGLLKKISRIPSAEMKQEDIQSEDGMSEHTEKDTKEVTIDTHDAFDTLIDDEWGRTHGSGIHVVGRIVLNNWRIMRGELKLRSYTLESVAESVLRRRVPRVPFQTLTRWFSGGPGKSRYRCIEHIVERAKLSLEIMFQYDMINRTSELARIFGIDFFSVLSRGSQYRVESMMLRLAHTQNFLAISPSRQQVASQPAMECLPLVMEPESKFYTDPVVVLDFQSLYPSMIIAYNLCFSTCLGKISAERTKVLGVTSYTANLKNLSEIKEDLFITPNGVMYVPPEVQPGVLPRLLDEILSTRIMVKTAMKKLTSDQRVLHRVFNSRQLALKLIANVTYGYTAAGFSGRMPFAELADSIVQCGRRTLENAINFVHSNNAWNARVVYGDTDSLFVLLKGRSRQEALRIGQEIANSITAINPYPVTLKMEKVYHPCALITKKRYVGNSYESCRQMKPTFDAKGIETIRRDGCLAVAKIMERTLKILFESRDLSEVKSYLYRQWKKILSGRVSLQDFIFSKEVRLGTYRNTAHSLPPAAIVATKAMRVDPRAEPLYGERISYVVVHGEPGARLVDMVVDPLELLDIHTSHRLHDTYYITKQIIPALQRVFGLVGADLKQWFAEMSRPVRPVLAKRQPNSSTSSAKWGPLGQCYNSTKYQKTVTRSTIDSYYLSQHCVVCGELIRSSLFACDNCSKDQQIVAMTLIGRTSKLEKEIEHLVSICRHCGAGCSSMEKGVQCISLDCPVFFERRKVQKEFSVVSDISNECGFYPDCMAELF